MTEFTKYNASTHPIIKLEDDWNNLLDHGLEKSQNYLIRKSGSSWQALHGSTSVVAKSSSDPSETLQWTHDQGAGLTRIKSKSPTMELPSKIILNTNDYFLQSDWSTIIKKAIALNDYLFEVTNRVSLRGLFIDNAAINPQFAIRFAGSTDSSMDYMNVQGGPGIYLQGDGACFRHSVIVPSAAMQALKVQSLWTRIHDIMLIGGNIPLEIFNSGIVQGVLIQIEDPTVCGAIIWGSYGGNSKINLSNLTIWGGHDYDGAGCHGIRLLGDTAINLDSPMIQRVGGHGISCESGEGVISNPSISNCGKYGAGVYSGIELNACSDYVINGGRITDYQGTKTQKYAVVEVGAADYNIVTAVNGRGNQNATKDFIKVGANSVFEHNIGRI